MPYIGNQPAQIAAYGVQSFNGGGTSFTLSKPATTETVLLFIDGVRQTPVDAYSVSGTTLTTTATTPSGTNNVTVQFLGDVVDFGEPSDNSVTSTKIVDGTIVNADINASAAIALSKLSTTGTPDSTTFLRGDGAWSAAGGGFNSVQVFTASGTWTRPSGVTKVIIEVQGAGGGGSSDTASVYYGHIGGGGGYAKKFLDVSSISTATITVGSGGAGVASGGTPNDGGASSWADGTNTVTGNGGPGGSPNRSDTTFRGLEGGTATGGDINIQGGPRSSHYLDQGAFGTSVLGTPGYGTSAVNTVYPSTSLQDAKGYGAGGGGTWWGATSGSGSDGIVIVWEYK
jgi:hypothetical protein